MTAIDATGLNALESLSDRLKTSGRALILCGARQQPAAFLHQAEFVEHVGAENILPNVEAALVRAQELRARLWSGRGYGAGPEQEAAAADTQEGRR
jgi:SulP family sulfate permease